MYLADRQALAEYCLRQLGAPVLNIEIADEQLSDVIENAIEFYQEYHFDGTERDILKHKIVGTELTLDTTTGLSVGDNLSARNTYASVVRVIDGTTIEISKMVGEYDWIEGDELVASTGGTYTIQTDGIVLGDPDNGWIPISEDVSGITRILPAMGYSEGLFDITYQLRMNELWDLSSVKMSYFTTSMEYLSLLDFLLRKEKNFRFNRRMNRLYLDINWKDDVKVGSYLIIDCYRIVSDQTFPELVNDPWLKEYATVLVKKQWGANLRKYNGVALPGGVTLDGERIYREAEEAKERLEQNLINNQAPLKFYLG